MNKIMSLTVIVTVGLAAGCGRHMGHMDSELSAGKLDAFIQKRLDKLMDKIDATDAQRSQIAAVKDRVVAELRTLKGDPQADHELLLAELRSDKPDGEKLHRLLDERIDKFRTMGHKGVDALLEVHAILTPEQRTQVESLVKEKMEKRRKGRFHRHW